MRDYEIVQAGCFLGIVIVLLIAIRLLFSNQPSLEGEGDYLNYQKVTLATLAKDEKAGPEERSIEVVMERPLATPELESYSGWVCYWEEVGPNNDVPFGLPRTELVRSGFVVKRPDAFELDNSNVGKRLIDLVGNGLVGVAPGEFTVGVLEFLRERPGISTRFSGIVRVSYHYDNPLGGGLATLLTFKDGKVVHRNVE